MKNIFLTVVLIFSWAFIMAQQSEHKVIEKNGDNYSVTIYHDNGYISQEGSYNLEGNPDGIWTSFDDNGNKVSVATYDNGIKTGTWLFYNGDVLKEVKYADNKITKVTTWKDSDTKIVSNFEKK